MLLAVHAHGARAVHACEEHVHLVVDVLSDATSGVEAHKVGVEILAPFERPDHTPTAFGSGK